MKTPAISNPAIVQSGTKSAAKSPDNSSGVLFDQALSQEIADRQAMSESVDSAASDMQTAPNAATAKTGAKPAKNGAGDDTQASGVDQSKTETVSDSAGKRVEQTDAASAAQEDHEAALVAASDQLLALVASLQQTSLAPGDAAVQDSAAAAFTSPGHIVTAQAGEVPVEADAAIAGDPLALAADAARDGGIETRTGLAAKAGAGTNPAASDLRSDTASLQSGKFDTSLAQARELKAAPQASAADARSGQHEFAAGMPPTQDLRTTGPAQDAQAALAPLNFTSSQAPLQQMQAAAEVTGKLAPHVGSPGWDQALGQRVVWMVSGGQQTASLTLNPPDLGPLQVVLNVSNSQATANFTAAQPEVRQALEASMPKLREMLGDAGIQLGQANVSAGTPNQQQNLFSGRHQPAPHSSRGENAPEAAVRAGTSQVVSGGRGLVDTFA